MGFDATREIGYPYGNNHALCFKCSFPWYNWAYRAGCGSGDDRVQVQSRQKRSFGRCV